MVPLRPGWTVRVSVLALLLAWAAPGAAATFSVNSNVDAHDGTPGDGRCETASGNGVCTLRAAVEEVQALIDQGTSRDNEIDVPGGFYGLTLGTGLRLSGLATTRIVGSLVAPSGVIVDGQQSTRVIEVDGGNVTISGLAIKHGETGIYSGAQLVVDRCEITANTMHGIFQDSYGTLTVQRSFISDNDGDGVLGRGVSVAVSDSVLELNGEGISVFGGVSVARTSIFWNARSGIDACGPISVENSTIAANGAAGVVETCGDADVTLRNCTVTDNFSGGLHVCAPTCGSSSGGRAQLHLSGTILSHNACDDCTGEAVSSEGYNLIERGAACTFAGGPGPGDLFDVEPRLGLLDDVYIPATGMRTSIQPLFAGSPAINGGDPNGCKGLMGVLTTDERGVARPQFTRCDIGALEYSCGNGRIDPDEDCDDGNTLDGDGCSATCRSEYLFPTPTPTDTPAPGPNPVLATIDIRPVLALRPPATAADVAYNPAANVLYLSQAGVSAIGGPSGGSIYTLDMNGTVLRHLDFECVYQPHYMPTSLSFDQTSGHLFVVAENGGDVKIVEMDPDGSTVFSEFTALYLSGGIVVRDDGIWQSALIQPVGRQPISVIRHYARDGTVIEDVAVPSNYQALGDFPYGDLASSFTGGFFFVNERTPGLRVFELDTAANVTNEASLRPFRNRFALAVDADVNSRRLFVTNGEFIYELSSDFFVTPGTCASPRVIPPQGGTVTGTTFGSSAQSGSCTITANAPEQVFVWTPSVSGTATFQTCSSSETAYDTVLYVRGGTCSDGTELACNDDTPGCGTVGSGYHGSRVTLPVSAGQPYYLFVDGYSGSSGDFALTVIPPAGSVSPTPTSIVPPTPTPTASSAPTNTTGSVPTPTPTRAPSATNTASSAPSPTPTNFGSGTCASPIVLPPQGGSFTGTTSGASAQAGSCTSTSTAPEQVFVWTPSVSGTATFQTCSATQTTYDTVLYVRGGTCSGGAELACNDDTTGCGTTTDPTNPHRGSRVTLSVTAGQSYYVFVDGFGGASGNFVLTIMPPGTTATPTPAPAMSATPTAAPSATNTASTAPSPTPTSSGSGTCASPIVLPPQGGTFTGTTSGASAQAGSCTSTSTAPEQVFVWTPSTSGTATVQTCSATQTTYDTVLYVRGGTCSGGTELACNDDTTGCGTTTDPTNPHRGSRVALTVTAGQSYYLIVDGFSGASGTFALTVFPPG
jgi:cysteine-rich repeat protein